jgi:hypothetical protein
LFPELLQHGFAGSCLFGFDFFAVDLLLNGVKYFDDRIDDPQQGSGNGDIEADHTDIDISLIAVVVDIIHNNQPLENNDAETAGKLDDHLRFAAVDVRYDEIDLEGQVNDVESHEGIDLN